MATSAEKFVLVIMLIFITTFAPIFPPNWMVMSEKEETFLYTISTNLVWQTLKNKPEAAKTVTNLYPTLQHFIKDNCLIAVNNYEGAGMYPSIEFPLILKQFELAEGSIEHKYSAHRGEIWIPRNMVARRNGNISVVWPKHYTYIQFLGRCNILKYVYSLWPADPQSSHCLGPNSLKFVLTSRPWQCEIQVELFMPEKLFREWKRTEIFDQLSKRSLNILPSLRPPVHILVDSKANVEDFEWKSLAAWTRRRDYIQNKNAQNDVHIIAHVACESFQSYKIKIQVECNIINLNVLYLCPECSHLLNKYPLNPDHLSFEEIAKVEKSQKYVGYVACVHVESETRSQIELSDRLAYYAKEMNEKLIRSPLLNLYKLGLQKSGELEMLAFGYASLFSVFMGNISMFVDISQTHNYNSLRLAFIEEIYKPKYDTVLQVPNDFGRLNFVSCGSRGIEPFPFLQFVAVYKWQVWVFILISGILPTFIIKRLYTDGKAKSVGLYCRIISIYKILVEQGAPFPKNFDKIKQMRFLMSGTLLAGLVISNAFKSENVYKIVMPRAPISYYNVDELIEDNVTVYSRIELYKYEVSFFNMCHFRDEIGYVYQSKFKLCMYHKGWVEGSTEIHKFETEKAAKIRNYSRLHPEELNVVAGPFQYLKEFFDVGIIDSSTREFYEVSYMLTKGHALSNIFHKRQESVIKSNLLNCSKSAWVLPNYLAQILHRMLKRAGKHSDVSVDSYTSPRINFYYRKAFVTSSILQQISWMPQTGLFEWWPKFVNRSDLVLGAERRMPVTPDMSGNILVIFIFLGGGLSIALVCLVAEFWRSVVLFPEIVWEFCVSKIQAWSNKCRNPFSKTIVTFFDDETI